MILSQLCHRLVYLVYPASMCLCLACTVFAAKKWYQNQFDLSLLVLKRKRATAVVEQLRGWLRRGRKPLNLRNKTLFSDCFKVVMFSTNKETLQTATLLQNPGTNCRNATHCSVCTHKEMLNVLGGVTCCKYFLSGDKTLHLAGNSLNSGNIEHREQ